MIRGWQWMPNGQSQFDTVTEIEVVYHGGLAYENMYHWVQYRILSWKFLVKMSQEWQYIPQECHGAAKYCHGSVRCLDYTILRLKLSWKVLNELFDWVGMKSSAQSKKQGILIKTSQKYFSVLLKFTSNNKSLPLALLPKMGYPHMVTVASIARIHPKKPY